MEIVRSQKKNTAEPSSPALSLYHSAPQTEVRLEEFEQFALDRLRVLTSISDGLSRGKKPDEMQKLVRELWKEHMRHHTPSESIKKDAVSHFILRFVVCRTEDLRKWFLSMETALFRYRFQLESPEAQRVLMNDCMCFRPISSTDFEKLKERLAQVARSLNHSLPNADSIYYKVPFDEGPELVATRSVLLVAGYAYVAVHQVVALLVTQFRSHLSKALVLTSRKWSTTIQESEKGRLAPIVEALSTRYLGPDYSQTKEFAEISLKDIDQIAKTSFPLCMRHLFNKLREEHHLKHGCRMQLGLFLKGVGLKLDDALAFWRAEFSQKVGAERFDKEYSYNVRHNYGKEGKRTDYTPFSCQKVITSTPGVGDHHGCPYRHFSEENLRAALANMEIGGRSIEEIMGKVRSRHYQLACTLTFEALHSCSHDSGINHPNQYFIDSRKILESKVDNGGGS